MEPDGHPTHDLVEELQVRGASMFPGNGAGPDPRYLDIPPGLNPHQRGLWLFMPPEVYDTGFDEPPELG